MKNAPLNEDSRQVAIFCYIYRRAQISRGRVEVLATVARRLEFDCHSMSTTLDGYTARSISAVDIVKSLAQPDAWRADESDEWEDARDLIEVMESVSKRVRSKGKGTVTGR